MKNTVLSNLRQCVFNRRFLLGAIFAALAVLPASAETLFAALRSEAPLPYGFHADLILQAARSDTFAFCLPIVSALPFAASYVDDVKTGFIKHYIHRTGRRAYILGRALGCAVSGGLVMTAGLIPAYAAAALVFLPMEAGSGAADAGQLPALLSACGAFFLSGGLWALAGLALSAPTASKYIAYGAPFILYYVLIILHERYFDRLNILYPKAWLLPGGDWGAVIVPPALMILAALCFGHAVKRRLSEI